MLIICLKESLEIARNMKFLLCLYEMMSGLKINFNKSEVIVLNGDESFIINIMRSLTIKLACFLSSIWEYLSVQVDFM